MTLAQPPADDDDLSAAFAALRKASVPLRPGFVTELRARLLAEIARTDQERGEVTSHASIHSNDAVPEGRRPYGVRAPGADLRRVRRPVEAE
jgi:hypothetical protein